MGTDTEDQKRLRVTISDEIEAVMRKHDVGGAVMLVSRESASWRMVTPPWVGIVSDEATLIRVQISSKDPDKNKGANTLFFIGSLRDMGSDLQNFYGRIWRVVVHALKAQGATVEHEPFGGGEGIDPQRGKVQ